MLPKWSHKTWTTCISSESILLKQGSDNSRKVSIKVPGAFPLAAFQGHFTHTQSPRARVSSNSAPLCHKQKYISVLHSQSDTFLLQQDSCKSVISQYDSSKISSRAACKNSAHAASFLDKHAISKRDYYTRHLMLSKVLKFQTFLWLPAWWSSLALLGLSASGTIFNSFHPRFAQWWTVRLKAWEAGRELVCSAWISRVCSLLF